MIILNCPKCSEAVTMASGMRPSSKVRCPLCQEEYVLADALGKLPPTLIALDEPVEEVERPLEPTWETGSSEVEESAAAAAPSFAFDTGAGTATRTAGAAPRVVTRPSPKRKPKNPVIEVVKVVGGGVAGLLIAQLILWWLPVKKYRRDPFEFGPKIANVAWLKFIVPEDFRNGTSAENGNSSLNSGGRNGGLGGSSGFGNSNPSSTEGFGQAPVDWNAVISGKPSTNSTAQTGKKGSGKGAAKPKATDPSDDLIVDDAPVKPAAAPDPFGVELANPLAPLSPPKVPVPAKTTDNAVPDDLTPPPPKPATKPSDDPAAPSADTPRPTPAEPTTPGDTDTAADSPAAPKSEASRDDNVKPATATAATSVHSLPLADNKVRSAEEITARATACRAASSAWLNSEQAERAERRRLGEAYYGSLAQLAVESAAPIEIADEVPRIHAAIAAVGRETLEDEILSKVVETVGRKHLADPSAAGRGIALVGTVKAVGQNPDRPQLSLEMQGSQPVVAIVALLSDSPLSLKAGQRVFVLGIVPTVPDDHRDADDSRPVVLTTPGRLVALPFEAPAEDAADPSK